MLDILPPREILTLLADYPFQVTPFIPCVCSIINEQFDFRASSSCFKNCKWIYVLGNYNKNFVQTYLIVKNVSVVMDGDAVIGSIKMWSCKAYAFLTIPYIFALEYYYAIESCNLDHM